MRRLTQGPEFNGMNMLWSDLYLLVNMSQFDNLGVNPETATIMILRFVAITDNISEACPQIQNQKYMVFPQS